MPSWDLEYILLFGPPENKLELIDGTTPTSFPFEDRSTADAHFALWAQILARWQNVADPPARVADGMLVKEFGEFTLEQYRRPVRLEVPSEFEAYDWAHRCFGDRGLWPMQPAGFETGSEWSQEQWRIKLNLWNIFREAKKRLGFDGHGIGGVDISLTDTDAVQPDFCYFLGPKERTMIAGEYFRGIPDLIMEVLSPFSRAIDRGPRKEVYRRVGVPQLWLIEPLTRTIELHRLINGEYRLEATVGAGDALAVPGFDGLTLASDSVFDSESDRPARHQPTKRKPPIEWAIPRDLTVGLQHLILLGHAERRREIWNNQSPCFLAFGSANEARHRLERFLLEAGRWEGIKQPISAEIEPGMETADVGRFHFIRQGHTVRLNIDVSGLLFRSLLEVTVDRNAWDWGETPVNDD